MRLPVSTRRARALAVLLAAVVLTACSGTEGTGDKGYISGDGVLRGIDVADRLAPVELEGVDLDGERVDVADLRGKVAVVNVWASWCPPCRAEADDLVAAAAETAGVAGFVGVNTKDNLGAARAFERAQDIPFPSISSPDGKERLAFQGQVPLGATPSTVVLDKQGRIAAVFNGRVPSTLTLVEVIEDVAETGAVDVGAGQDPEDS